MRNTRVTTLALFACSACNFVEEGMSDDSSSSGFTDAEETFDPSVGTTQAATATASTTSSASTSSATTDESSSSDSGDPTFGDDATTTHGESSTGEVVTDWALAFNGDGSAISAEERTWSPSDFTVEVWIEITSEDASGILIDQQSSDLTSGWALYFNPPESMQLVASFFADDGALQFAVGPTAEEIGLGWHHIAATHSGSTLLIHVDGVSVAAEPVEQGVMPATTEISLGYDEFAGEQYTLQGISIDDIRVTEDAARYVTNFDPPVDFDTEGPGDVTFLLDCDEGSGVSVTDSVSDLVFSIENAAWVTGNTQ